jgi:hypothetical protein
MKDTPGTGFVPAEVEKVHPVLDASRSSLVTAVVIE